MKWLEALATALKDADPVVVTAILALAFAGLLHSIASKALSAVERVARQRNKK